MCVPKLFGNYGHFSLFSMEDNAHSPHSPSSSDNGNSSDNSNCIDDNVSNGDHEQAIAQNNPVNNGQNGIYREFSNQIEEAIISNDSDKLCKLLKSTLNINLVLSEQKESVLILAIKLSKLDIVNILLDHNCCDINKLNNNQFSPLDVALITTFDNRLEPRHSMCWKIVSMLLDHQAEPSSRDAMMYVVRTALKYIDDQFINHLLEVFLQGSVAPIAHELLLIKIHRSQPIYEGNIDHFLIKISQLAVKIIKQAKKEDVCQIVNCFVYYVDSYWTCRELQVKTLRALVLYLSACGWKWRRPEITLVNRVSENLSMWCQNLSLQVPSLQHLCKVKVRNSANISVFELTNKLSLPNSIKQYIMLNDIDKIIGDNDSVNNIFF